MTHPTPSCVFEFCEAAGFHPTSRQKQVLGSVLAGVKSVDCGKDQALAEVLLAWRSVRRADAKVYVIVPSVRTGAALRTRVQKVLQRTPWASYHFETVTRHSLQRLQGVISYNVTVAVWACADQTKEESSVLECLCYPAKDRLKIEVSG
jgi:hypothetical protein